MKVFKKLFLIFIFVTVGLLSITGCMSNDEGGSRYERDSDDEDEEEDNDEDEEDNDEDEEEDNDEDEEEDNDEDEEENINEEDDVDDDEYLGILGIPNADQEDQEDTSNQVNDDVYGGDVSEYIPGSSWPSDALSNVPEYEDAVTSVFNDGNAYTIIIGSTNIDTAQRYVDKLEAAGFDEITKLIEDGTLVYMGTRTSKVGLETITVTYGAIENTTLIAYSI